MKCPLTERYTRLHGTQTFFHTMDAKQVWHHRLVSWLTGTTPHSHYTVHICRSILCVIRWINHVMRHLFGHFVFVYVKYTQSNQHTAVDFVRFDLVASRFCLDSAIYILFVECQTQFGIFPCSFWMCLLKHTPTTRLRWMQMVAPQWIPNELSFAKRQPRTTISFN